jgi:hypothetical protein
MPATWKKEGLGVENSAGIFGLQPYTPFGAP